ncbi:MAG: NUDIX domain-containing protein [Terriglobales bacterium]
MPVGPTLFRLCSRLVVATYGRFPVFGELPSAAAVIRRGELFLLQWRSDGLGWAFPGGTSRPGESPEHTLRREVREETGLHLHSCQLLFAYSDRHHIPSRLSVFTAHAEGRLRSSWEGLVEWRPLPAEPFFLPQLPILDYLRDHPQS